MTLRWPADRFYEAIIDLLKDWHTPGQRLRGTLGTNCIYLTPPPPSHMHATQCSNVGLRDQDSVIEGGGGELKNYKTTSYF